MQSFNRIIIIVVDSFLRSVISIIRTMNTLKSNIALAKQFATKNIYIPTVLKYVSAAEAIAETTNTDISRYINDIKELVKSNVVPYYISTINGFLNTYSLQCANTYLNQLESCAKKMNLEIPDLNVMSERLRGIEELMIDNEMDASAMQ